MTRRSAHGVRVTPISDGGAVTGFVVRGVDTVEQARRAALLHPCAEDDREDRADPRYMNAETGFFAWRIRGDMWEPSVMCIEPVEPGAPGAFLACYLSYPVWSSR